MLLLITIFLISAIITFVTVCCYIKLLAVASRKLRYALYKVDEAMSDVKQGSCLESFCIRCFDKTHKYVRSQFEEIK